MEVRFDLKAHVIKKVCDRCKSGEMKPTGSTLTSLPPQYAHQCEVCGNQETYGVIYPSVELTN